MVILLPLCDLAEAIDPRCGVSLARLYQHTDRQRTAVNTQRTTYKAACKGRTGPGSPSLRLDDLGRQRLSNGKRTRQERSTTIPQSSMVGCATWARPSHDAHLDRPECPPHHMLPRTAWGRRCAGGGRLSCRARLAVCRPLSRRRRGHVRRRNCTSKSARAGGRQKRP